MVAGVSRAPNWQSNVPGALYEVSAAIREYVDPRQLAERIGEQVRRLFRAQTVTVFAWHEESGALASMTGADGSVGSGIATIADEAFRQQRPVLSPTRRGNMCSAAVPLIVGQRAIGVLLVEHDHRRTYTADDLSMLALFAALTAPALDRARWHAESEAQSRAATEQNDRLTQILQQLPSGVVVLDNRGFVLLSNPALQHALDFEIQDDRPWADQLDGYVAYEPFDRHELRADEAPAARVLAGERVVDEELVLRHAAPGVDQWLRVDGVSLRDARGRPSGAILVFTDVTRERMLARDLAATALEHARLLGELAERRGRLERLADQIAEPRHGAAAQGEEEPHAPRVGC
jgi:GAF domain-containing protein